MSGEEGLKVKATLVRARSEESEFTCKNIDLYHPRLLEALDYLTCFSTTRNVQNSVGSELE